MGKNNANTSNEILDGLSLSHFFIKKSKQESHKYEKESYQFTLSENVSQKIIEISDKSLYAEFIVLLSGVKYIMHKLGDDSEISVITKPFKERNGGSQDKIILLKSCLENEFTYREYLSYIKKIVSSSIKDNDFIIDINAFINGEPMDYLTLAGIAVILENIQDKKGMESLGLDIMFNFNIQENRIGCCVEYNSKLLESKFIKHIACYIENFFEYVVNNPDAKLSLSSIMPSEEVNRILNEFNNTRADYPKEKTIYQMFEEQVKKTPESIAIINGNEKVTYNELNKKANQLARVLRDMGVTSDTPVAIMVERSTEMFIGILGILKAGGAYLPISPEYPQDRKEYMLLDSKARLLLTQSDLLVELNFNGHIIALNRTDLYCGDTSNLIPLGNSNNLAYIIYTSGSTGKPKGVMIEHHSVINRINWMQKKYPIGESDVILQKTAFTFDVSVWELFWWAFVGAKVSLLVPGGEKDPREIINNIKKSKVTAMHFVPSMLSTFLEYIEELEDKYELASLDRVFASGEALTPKQVERFNKVIRESCGTKLINLYGPTEATVDVSYFDCPEDVYLDMVPIGKPIDNINLYVVDKNNRLQPIGIMGELCIGGAGLARGYLNRLDLTKEKFVDNPYIEGEKMYRTGDLARWLPDGNIEFLGRIDHQIKIRGYRIELGEIENTLLENESIKEVVVVAKEDNQGNKELYAYFCADIEISPTELKAYLAKELPQYMIPTYYMQLEKMPLSSNGKIDRKTLPEPTKSNPFNYEYEGAKTETQKKMLCIWEEVLDVCGISIDDSFLDLGGHSLKAVSLITRIHREFNVVIPLSKVFELLSVRRLSEYLKGLVNSTYQPIQPAEKREHYPASLVQKRMYMLNQFEDIGSSYNITVPLIIEGELDLEKFTGVFRKLVERHESLRTSFENSKDGIVQRIHEQIEFSTTTIKDIDCSEDEIVRAFAKPFDLSRAPLFRVGIAGLQKNRHLLIMDMHHIISDGASVEVLIKEALAIYEEKALPELKIQYKDYSEWFRENAINSGFLLKQEEYWLGVFQDGVPALNIPTDYKRSYKQRFEGDSVYFELDYMMSDNLRGHAKKANVTIYMLLLSAWNILLHKYSRQEDIVVGTTLAARTHAELEDSVGMFVNTIVMRNYPHAKKTYVEFLTDVKENCLKVYENQNYEFGELVEKLGVTRDLSRNPIFDTMFIMQNNYRDFSVSESLNIIPLRFSNLTSKFDISIEIIEYEGKFEIELKYCTKLFKKETIRRLGSSFINILKSIIKNPTLKIEDIEIISVAEQNRIIYEFNNTKVDYAREKTIHTIFEEQAAKTPDEIAVVCSQGQISYKGLNEKANQLAKVLRSKGIVRNMVVAIITEPSIEMMVGIFAVMKAGGTYLPIAHENPQERIKYILDDSGTGIILIQEHLRDSVCFNGDILELEDQSLYQGDALNPINSNDPEDFAYLIYTSGTTGVPKGTLIKHKGLVNYSIWFKNTAKLNGDRTLLLASFAFDLGYTSIFPALISGSELHMLPKETYINREALINYITEKNITYIKLTPSLFNIIINSNSISKGYGLDYLRLVVLGGERVNLADLEKFNKLYPDKQVMNHYGPTETTIGAIANIIDFDRFEEYKNTPVIGRPINNTRIYILDSNSKCVPIGVIGELCISGDGLAGSYLNREQLTREKFIENPLINGELIYKTGDQARWLTDGTIEFIGRIDSQIKVRGYRVELSEVERQILKHGVIRECFVSGKEDSDGSTYLCAYLVGVDHIDLTELREQLFKILPEYMVPSYFIQVDQIPLTPNGKVDLKALPEPGNDNYISTDYEVPSNEMEEIIVDIWKHILKANVIGVNDNFFNLGGHSLKAAILISKIQEKLNVEVPLKEIFNNPTVKGISQYIKNAKPSTYSPIEPVNERDFYPVSSIQKRLYALQQYDENSIGYNMTKVISIEGEIDKERLEESFMHLLKRHESLRTSFHVVDEEILQRVEKSVDFSIDFVEGQEEHLEKILDKSIKPFSLNIAPLLRIKLIQVTTLKHIMVLDIHHIISDRVSIDILLEELCNIYNGNELINLKIQYKDYIVWYDNKLKNGQIKEQEAYWMSVLGEGVEVVRIPTDFPRPTIQRYEGDSLHLELESGLVQELMSIRRETETSLYMILSAAYNILLSKYSGQEDITVGSPITGRSVAGVENLIGAFINTLAIRNFPNCGKTFREFLNEVKWNFLRGYENCDYPFEELINRVSKNRDISRNPLFDTMFVLQSEENRVLFLNGASLKQLGVRNKVSKFDIVLEVIEGNGKLSINIEYSINLFTRDTVERMARHYINILHQVKDDLDIKLKDVSVLGENELEEILDKFNNTESDYPSEKTIYQVFEEQVEKTPEKIAALFGSESITYDELNKKANQLARLLRDKGVVPDTPVAIMVERSFEMLIGIMGILKAGGAYLPISLEYPLDRRQYMLQDSNAEILLTHKHLKDSLSFAGEVITLDEREMYAGNDSNLKPQSCSKNLAYIIYTSGSTGKPKGVMIEHHSVINRINWMQKKYPIGESDVILQKTAFTFDVSVWELFWWAFVGAKVSLLVPGGEKDPREIISNIERNKVTTMHFVPSMLNTFLEYVEGLERKGELSSLKRVFASGEALTVKQVERFRKNIGANHKARLTNLYGPTEATVDVSYFDCPEDGCLNIVPIGKPIDNIKLYVVDRNNMLQPIGIPGELCIGGVGLARGYWNRIELTNEKFVDNPFAYGEKMYRTGDLARWMPDGNIEFLGRIDHQVKIRGYRIELGEIENLLLQYAPIKEVITLERKDAKGDSYLVAYYVGDRDMTIEEIQGYLAKWLPEYMIPSYIIRIDKMPINSSGKVARNALPEPCKSSSSKEKGEISYNKTEQRLLKIWEHILCVEDIGVNDNFFHLGGHSLKVISLISRIYKEFNREFSMSTVFKFPTIKELATLINCKQEDDYTELIPCGLLESYPVSSSQKRMFITNQLYNDSTNYNIRNVLWVKGKLDKDRLQSIFTQLMIRHESLRTCFELTDENIIQKVHESPFFKMDYFESKKEDVDTIIKAFIRPYNLDNAPLFRVGLIKIREGEHILIFDMHHIIADGVSVSILLKEMSELYQGNCLSEVRLQYKDYSEWNNKFLATEKVKMQEDYWLSKFEKRIPTNDLPLDYPRPATRSFEGGSVDFILGKDLVGRIRDYASETKTTIYMITLTAYYILLSRFTGLEDIVVGTPISGRHHPGSENMIGMFVNTIALRNFPEANKKIKTFVEDIRSNALQAFENQDYPFENLVDKLNIARNLSRNPIFDTVFSLDSGFTNKIELSDLSFLPYKLEHDISKFDITFEGEVREGEIYFTIEYCKKLFKNDTMKRLASDYIKIINSMLEYKDKKIGEIGF